MLRARYVAIGRNWRNTAYLDWYRFREAEFAKIAIDWLEENGVAYERDLQPRDKLKSPGAGKARQGTDFP
ncbi:MAG TPA: hypothetical protein VJ124_06340 [Pyrinomonadaceae bacterium]|nr:hypothetical protein [Pyrinomonadaceae bacterium]